mgnify:CR=1 FL=1
MILFDLGLLREVYDDWQTRDNNTIVTIDLEDVDYITVKTDTDVTCMYFTYSLDDIGNRIPIEGATFKITKDDWEGNSHFSVYIADESEAVRNRKVAVTKVSTFTKID